MANNWINRNEFQDYPPFYMYCWSLYFTLTTLSTVGYGDISGKTVYEETIAIFYMFFGVMFYSYFIGMFTSVMQFISIQETSLQKNLKIMNELCNNMDLPLDLKNKMQAILEYNSANNAFLWVTQTNIF
mgnify:CR=1 FL=1